MTETKQTIERWYSTKEICEYLGVSRDTVMDWIAEKNMPAHRMGRNWKYKPSEVDAWIRNGNASDGEKTGETNG